MPYKTPVIPCYYFNKDDGCSHWCMNGDLDCCVICCRRKSCNDLCPRAQKLLEIKRFKDKHYPWDIALEEEKKEWFGDDNEE